VLEDVKAMANITHGSSEEGKKPDWRWALFTTLGTFFLYLFGYLSLRFHLSTFGVSTDIAVLDDRYLFAGAQFLVYFVCSIPIVLLFALPLYGLLRRVLARASARWLPTPNRVLVAAVVVSVVLLQVVIRQCLPFADNLLLQKSFPQQGQSGWFGFLLLQENQALPSLYFSGLVAAAFGLFAVLWIANHQPVRPSPLWSGLLGLLIVIHFLLLPVTFGILIADQYVPRVTTLNGKEILKPNERAWRIWEGQDQVTFLVRTWEKGASQKEMVTMDKKRIEKVEISSYEQILKQLY
jgi:hypothetical protein